MTKEILLIIVAIVFSSALIFACAWIGGPCDGCDDTLDIGDGTANPCGQTKTVDDNSLNRVCDYGVNESKPVQFRPDVQSISRGEV